MYDYEKDMARIQAKINAQDRQIEEIHTAEAKYKEDGDIEVLIQFWEKLWAKGGLIFNGIHWHYRLIDLYYKSKRYDDAWRMLNIFVGSKPEYIINTRKWQIKTLKKEKKDYAYIQDLLDAER